MTDPTQPDLPQPDLPQPDLPQPDLPQPDLRMTTLALEAEHERLGWGLPARLYGISAGLTWVQVDEGEPYDIVELFTLLPDEDFIAVALVVEGWAAPPGTHLPSRHPCRERIRTAVSVGRDGGHVSVLRRKGRTAEVVEGGQGALMERLLSLWDRATAVDN
jgi:hypothetical protein